MILMFKIQIAPEIEKMLVLVGSIGGKLREWGGSFKVSTHGREDYVVINKHRIFELLEIRYTQRTGQVLSEIRHRIKSFGKISPIEVGEGGTNPEGIGVWSLGKNDVSMWEGPGLSGGELINAYSTIGIFKNYRFREEATRRTTPIDFVTYLK